MLQSSQMKFPKPKKEQKNKKRLNKVKKTPISKMKRDLMELVKYAVKKRDNFTCQKCGKKVTGSNCHTSHVIPVSSGNRLAFDPINMKVLCYHDHINWWHKNPIDSVEWFKAKFPERYQYLISHKYEIVKWKETDYLAKIETARNEINDERNA